SFGASGRPYLLTRAAEPEIEGRKVRTQAGAPHGASRHTLDGDEFAREERAISAGAAERIIAPSAGGAGVVGGGARRVVGGGARRVVGGGARRVGAAGTGGCSVTGAGVRPRLAASA